MIRCRLERAKELLLTTDLKMEEIAQLCGCDTGSNFSLFFGAGVNCSPSEFRRKLPEV